MAHGQNTAKKIVIDEANDLANKLKNGQGADPETQGKAIGLLCLMVGPLFEAEFVTVQECEMSRVKCQEKMLDQLVLSQVPLKGVEPMKVKFMGVEFSGKPVSGLIMKALTLVPFLVLFYMMGKLLEWW